MSSPCPNSLKLKNEVSVWIPAPPERVWQFFSDFERWPEWACGCREVRRSGSGWCLVYRAERGPDLCVAVRAARVAPYRLEFAPLEDVPHNLEVLGWVAFEPDPQGTQVCLSVEAQASLHARRLRRHPERWAGLLLEHSRGLLQDLRKALLEPAPAQPVRAEPLPARPLPALVYR